MIYINQIAYIFIFKSEMRTRILDPKTRKMSKRVEKTKKIRLHETHRQRGAFQREVKMDRDLVPRPESNLSPEAL